MSFGGFILTSGGRVELAKAEMGQPLEFDYMAIGDGRNSSPVTALESLVHELHQLPILSVSRDGDTIIVDAELNNDELQEGFYFREIGLYANGILYSYDNAGADAEYIDAKGSAVVKQKRIRIALTISSEAVVSTTLDPGLHVLQKDFDTANKKMSQMKDKLDGIEESANNYKHPDGPGSRHIPSGGTAGQLLKRGEKDGEAAWGDILPEDIGAAKSSIYGDDFINLGDNYSVARNCVSLGGGCSVSGGYSSVLSGTRNTVSGYGASVLCGSENNSSGAYSTSSGQYCQSKKDCCAAFGYQSNSDNFAAAVFGKCNKAMNSGGSYNSQIGDVFVIGNGTSESSRSNAMRVTYLGDIMGTKAFQSSGADYAEYIKPWWDGNIYAEDRVGYFVTVKDGLLYKAGEGDYIYGITSGNPSVVGNADEDYYWKYERDEFNRIVMEDVPEMKIKTKTIKVVMPKYETKIVDYIQPDDEDWEPEHDEDGNPVPNAVYGEVEVLGEDGEPVMEEVERIEPVRDEKTGEYVMEETGKIIKIARMKLAADYDPSLQDSYVPRSERPEWDYVGMVGVLPVRDDSTCIPGKFCKCGNSGIATLAEKRGFDTYMVIERISKYVVSVIMK